VVPGFTATVAVTVPPTPPSDPSELLPPGAPIAEIVSSSTPAGTTKLSLEAGDEYVQVSVDVPSHADACAGTARSAETSDAPAISANMSTMIRPGERCIRLS
jgi:hypothetical protein